MEEKKIRLSTKLECEGAEFLVLGNLLINKIVAYKAYTYNPNYDIIAANPDSKKSVSIQVKSRFATDSNKRFLVRSVEADFYILVLLNRGVRGYRKITGPEKKEPEFFVIPKCVAQQVHLISKKNGLENRKMPSVGLGDIENCHQYLNAWNIISESLL